MRRRTLPVICAVCLSALATSGVVGCSSSGSSAGGMMGNGGSGATQGGGPNTSPGGGMMGGGSGATSYSSVGQRIFLSGVGANGQAIAHTASAVSQGSLMMGGGGCASCHGANGRGATIKMMSGTAVKAPDITYGALITAGFTDATIGRAVRDGLDESGKPLNDAMPRWRMSDADVAATIAYLRTLGAQ